MQDYVEQTEVRKYLWRWCNHLFTDEERNGPSIQWLRNKVPDVSAHELYVLSEERFDEVRPAVLHAVDQFNETAIDRVLHDHTNLEINRCPSCVRIVASPEARQCLWCGHDWHADYMK